MISYKQRVLKALISFFFLAQVASSQPALKVLNFQADNGYQHKSKSAGKRMIEGLGAKNNWEVISSSDTSIITFNTLRNIDVLIFNNNCGSGGRIFSDAQQLALQSFVRNGGGFVAIHCAGAIWHEEGAFQDWYEGLVGTRLITHPKVQPALIHVEDQEHISTGHLPKEWHVRDEYHTFTYSPRKHVNVLMSLDESTYEGEPKMGGDHPFAWYQYYDGGRSFFTSLGHTFETYADEDYRKLVEGGIIWASGYDELAELPIEEGLLLDLNADQGIRLEDGMRVSSWKNSVNNTIKSFDKQDKGRQVAGSGRPRLKANVPALNGHNSLVFHRQELVNHNEDAFDHLTTGSGYTWLAVMSAYEQIKGKPGVNSFFGNLRNTNVDKKGQYEGFWGGLSGDNRPWCGARNALHKGLWNENSPHVIADEALQKNKYYLVMGRLGAGQDTVPIELFVNSIKPVAKALFPVNPEANPSKLLIGQERDATNHPGAESFDGEIARFMIFERPLSNEELEQMRLHLMSMYNIKE